MPQRHSYGRIKDKPDSRDFIYHIEQDVKRIEEKVEKTPSPVDLRSQDSPIVDQGQLGSCTANAWAGALAFLEIKDGLQDSSGQLNFSRLFIYYNERVIEGTPTQDSGAELRDGAKTLAGQGSCYETTWPYDISQFATQPPANAVTEGTSHEITQYFRINDGDTASMKACLDAGFPFVFGFTVYDSFESGQVAQTGVVPMPNVNNEQVLGGHAVMCVGYDDNAQTFLCRNSWGTSWGMSGYFTLPYAYLTDPTLASDFWTVRKGTNMVAHP